MKTRLQCFEVAQPAILARGGSTAVKVFPRPGRRRAACALKVLTWTEEPAVQVFISHISTARYPALRLSFFDRFLYG